MECYNGDKIYDHVSKEAVLAIKKEIPSEEAILKVSDIFKMLSSPSRLKILYALRAEKLCVHLIAKIVEMEISAVSHHLKLLKLQNLIKSEKKGKEVYYSLADKHIISLIDNIYEHIKEKS